MIEIITKTKTSELELVDDYSFHEINYNCGSKEVYIEHHIEYMEGVSVLFAEKDHVIEIRNKLQEGEVTENDLIEAMNGELNDIYDYDKIAAIRNECGTLEWL